MSAETYDVAVIGAGIVGAAVAWELASFGARVVVLEAKERVAAGVTGTNSGLVCTGFDARPGSLECRMIRRHAERWRAVFGALGVPYRVPGALVLARDGDEPDRLEALERNAEENGVSTEMLGPAQLASHQPGLTASRALFVPGEAITDPYEATTCLLEPVGEVRLGWRVHDVEAAADGVTVWGQDGSLGASFVVNCAGLHADEIAPDGTFTITPRRGSFLAYGPETSRLLEHILLPLPTAHSKGVLVFPTVHGRLVTGPTAIDQQDKHDWTASDEELEHVRRSAVGTLPALERHRPTHAWAGLRTVGRPHDYIVRWSERVPRQLNIAGIRSTGLSACLGLSELAKDMLEAAGFRSRTAPMNRQTAAGSGVPQRSSRPWWERLPHARSLPGAAPNT